MSAQFSTWKDRGDNVGIECLVCHRTHWSEKDPATHPITQQPCENCKLIKEEKVLASENAKHKKELENYEVDKAAAMSGDDQQNPENSAGEEVKLDCDHQPSQP